MDNKRSYLSAGMFLYFYLAIITFIIIMDIKYFKEIMEANQIRNYFYSVMSIIIKAFTFIVCGIVTAKYLSKSK
jgi:hypothetical protein